MASPTPVLPDVGSTIVPPGWSFPSCSALSIIARPIRSFTDPPGFRYSSLAISFGLTPRPSASSRTIGVWPTSSRTEGYSRVIGGEVYSGGVDGGGRDRRGGRGRAGRRGPKKSPARAATPRPGEGRGGARRAGG